jgi:NAD(P)-dependent dehydrogenase (short-subunit alcohol dehydrogenase family)
MHKIGVSKRPDLPLAVVVGAGGMGMAVARRLGQSHRLLLADCNGEHLERQISSLNAEGHDIVGVICDVSAEEDILKLAEQAAGAGPIRTLAYVVGLSPSLGDFRNIMSVNLIGATRAAQAFREKLAPGGCGIFISSSAAHMQTVPENFLKVLDTPLAPGFLDNAEAMATAVTSAQAYMLSKAALIRMCQRVAKAWGRRGLRIISLSPGLIATPQGAREFERSSSKHRLLKEVPLAREGTMLEVANVVEFLASDRASFISGTDILVDGGMIASLKYAEAGHSSSAENF